MENCGASKGFEFIHILVLSHGLIKSYICRNYINNL